MKTQYAATSLDDIARDLLDRARLAESRAGRSKHEREVSAAYARGLLKAVEILQNTVIEPEVP